VEFGLAPADALVVNLRHSRRGFLSKSLVSGGLSAIANSKRYLMPLSARTSTFGGIVRPICLAAFKLMTNSNFIGCSTGRSAGLAPFRILSTYVAARLSKSAKLLP